MNNIEMLESKKSIVTEAIKDVTAKVYQILLEYNNDELSDLAEDMDDICGVLDDQRWHDWDYLDDVFYHSTIKDVLEELSNLDTNDDYVRETCWGWESSSERDYTDYITNDMAEHILWSWEELSETVHNFLAEGDQVKMEEYYDIYEYLKAKEIGYDSDIRKAKETNTIE